MAGRMMTDDSYRFGFNGKEKDSDGEWGSSAHYDYGFRIYDPSIARFLSVDPLTREYPFYTPYQFAGNKPIWAIDLDGLEELISTDAFTKYYSNLLDIASKNEILQNSIDQISKPERQESVKIYFIINPTAKKNDSTYNLTSQLKFIQDYDRYVDSV